MEVIDGALFGDDESMDYTITEGKFCLVAYTNRLIISPVS